ncbi:MAG: hypothetical protein WAM30_08285 [Candidatus Dormiibacterota bacterium]
MKVLLTDASGLTSRQVATRLSLGGHHVEALTSSTFCVDRFTRHVRRLQLAPRFGDDPFAWLESAIDVYRAGRFDLLFPTQEPVAVLAHQAARLRSLGVRTLVPDFAALRRVQDKVSATRTLAEAGIPQPETIVARAPADLAGWHRFPAFVKLPVGTASRTIWRVVDAHALRALLDGGEIGPVTVEHPVVVQQAIAGDLVMVQALFDRGRLVGLHAVRRVCEGLAGGAAVKEALQVAGLREQAARLGAELGWHGPLSADVLLGAAGPRWIDVNPRLVEPMNACLAGVDLVDRMLALAAGERLASAPDGRAGLRTHQAVLALLLAATRGRATIVTEVGRLAARRAPYAASREELTPLRHDWRAASLPVLIVAATLVRPQLWSVFGGAPSGYALSATGWEALCARPVAGSAESPC